MKLKLIAFLLGFMCLSTIAIAQNKIADSLKAVLQKHAGNDTSTIVDLANLAIVTQEFNNDEAMNYAFKALHLANKTNKPLYSGIVYKALGVIYLANNILDSSKYYYNHAIYYLKQANAIEEIGMCNYRIGLIYQNENNYKKASEYHREAYLNFIKVKNHYKSGVAAQVLGNDYKSAGDYKNAMDAYWKSIEHFEKNKSWREVSLTYLNVGIIYSRIRNYKKALDINKKAEKIFIENHISNNLDFASIYMHNANYYDYLHQTDLAIENYEKALSLYEKENDAQGVYKTKLNLGIAYKDMGKITEGLFYLNFAVNNFDSNVVNETDLAVALVEYADAIKKASDSSLILNNISLKGKNGIIQSYLKKAFEIADNNEDYHTLMSSSETLANYYENKSDYKNSLFYYKKFKEAQDSILSVEKQDGVLREEYEYEAARADELNNLKIQEKNKEKNIIIICSIVLLAFAGLAFYLFKRNRDAKLAQKEAEMNAQAIDNEMKVLRLQMNPHFIFNSLNSIANYIQTNNITDADNYLSKFSKLMRLTLENSMHKEIPLSDELKALELYMQLEAKRLNNKFKYEINIAPDVHVENIMVPPLIMQPFIENSIWHGIAKKEGEGKITIEIKRKDTQLNVVMEDDGIGRKKAAEAVTKHPQYSSKGIKITTDRIDILNKIKNAKSSLEIKDLDKGTQVDLKLPYQTENDAV